MKKLLIIFAAGVLLASCSATQDKEAAAAFCNCYTSNEGGDATSFSEMMEASQKITECIQKFQKDFTGKITEDGFREELTNQCPDYVSKAEELGIIK